MTVSQFVPVRGVVLNFFFVQSHVRTESLSGAEYGREMPKTWPTIDEGSPPRKQQFGGHVNKTAVGRLYVFSSRELTLNIWHLLNTIQQAINTLYVHVCISCFSRHKNVVVVFVTHPAQKLPPPTFTSSLSWQLIFFLKRKTSTTPRDTCARGRFFCAWVSCTLLSRGVSVALAPPPIKTDRAVRVH